MKVYTERVFPFLLFVDLIVLFMFGMFITLTNFSQRPEQINAIYYFCGIFLLVSAFTVIRYLHEKKNYLLLNERGITEVKNNQESLIPWDKVDFAAIYYVLTDSSILIHVKNDKSTSKMDAKKFNIKNTKQIRSYLSQHVRVIDSKRKK